MHSRFPLSFLFIAAATLGHGQTVPPAFTPPPKDEVIQLDAVVVTGDPDPKTVFDLAQGASILSGASLHLREEGTLGETLSALPGVSSTYYGPGASRPIIRGLGGDRVRMLDNGVGSLDASNVSPDHNVSLEPLLVESIEVLRGPSTLLYGSSAVGGVVNVIDNRIPSTAPDRLISGRVEARFDTASDERTGVITTTAGNEHFALQVEGLRTETDDVDIPGYAQTGLGAPPGQIKGTLPSSATSTKSGSVGGSFFWAAGFAGVSVSEYDTLYGVPTGDIPPINIDMQQKRLDFRSEITRPFGLFKAAKVRFGLADYTHSEIDAGASTPNTTFHNHAYEGRIELLQEDAGDLSGTIGLQTSRSDFSAVGDEVVTPETLTYNHALFALEEYKLNPKVTLQFGGRYEYQSVKLGTVDPLLPAFPGYSATSGETRTDHGFSFSTGAVYYPAKDYSLGLSLAWSQRIPVPQEMFSNGPHGGTGAYEVGTSSLDKETSLGLDLTLRKRAGFVTGSVGGFVNRFKNFVYEQLIDPSPAPSPSNPDALPVYQFIAKDALFYGGEAEITLHFIDTEHDKLHLDFTSDYVRAQQTTDDQPLPRIPPLRAGAGLSYEHGPWTAGLNVQHAFAQDRYSPSETETPDYTLVGANLGYRFTLARVEYEFFARGSNLLNEEARVSTSFLRDFAPLPGRNVVFGLRASF
ncbi:MAG: TonB-dependent receptor [Verrucomicrobia bacterium]|nr:TonB-dependent receptor [Verrucomicrobiota bacterium]